MENQATLPLLETVNLSKHFGGLAAVDRVSIVVDKGTISSLIGPNGAGKTTFFNVLCGLVEPNSGHVKFKGKDITGLPFHRVVRLGIGRSFQRTQIFRELTVFENVRVAAQSLQHDRLSPFSVPKASDKSHERAYKALGFVGLTDRAKDMADVLSHGEQRALDVAIALATEPSLLLLDEPTSGMSSAEVTTMTSLIRKLRDDLGITVLLVEHNMNLIMSISDVVTVLHQGRLLARGLPEEIKGNQEVVQAYLGTSVDA